VINDTEKSRSGALECVQECVIKQRSEGGKGENHEEVCGKSLVVGRGVQTGLVKGRVARGRKRSRSSER
jgi:hypothetical protein